MSPNPGFLKLDLAIRGARLDEAVGDDTGIFRVPSVRDYVGRSLELVLPEEVSVSVPVSERFTNGSPYVLERNGSGFRVSSENQQCEVRVVPQPRYYGETTSSGLPMWQVGTTYGGYIAINPAAGCAFTRLGVPCHFCDLPARAVDREKPVPVGDVLETIRAAFAEGAVEFVYLHVGYLEGEDAGLRFLEPYVDAIKKHFDTLIALQRQPPQSDRWIDQTYGMGIDALSYSVQREHHNIALDITAMIGGTVLRSQSDALAYCGLS